MMREILFRGKRVDNGEWVLGQVVIRPDHDDGCEKYFICEAEHRFIRCLNKMPCTYEAIPETVGQYTGMTDKNGKRIFEGDILQITTFNGFIDRCVVGYGTFEAFGTSSKNVGFYLYWRRDKERRQKYANIAWWLETRGAVCVGNIHDNPELLEVETCLII